MQPQELLVGLSPCFLVSLVLETSGEASELTVPPQVNLSVCLRDFAHLAPLHIGSQKRFNHTDLIKVRLQTSQSSNIARIVSDVFKNEGPLAFYKVGLSSCPGLQG